MIAQLTHLRPRPGKVNDVLALLRAWGEETRNDAHRPIYSFLCQDEDHLFVVSLYASREAYEAAFRDKDPWLQRLMPLLVEGHGPTYYGEVLSHDGAVTGTGPHVTPAGLRVGNRHPVGARP